MMILWNHIDALMYRVFPSSLGDLRLKWFDKLPAGTIWSFHQLTESFVTLFVINTKAPKGVVSLLTLQKGKNESLCNYNKLYLELYNRIEECSKELDVVSYRLGLTLREKLWEELILSPPTNLRDLMTQVEMFAWLKDDVLQAERATGSSSWGDGTFKKQRENSTDYESWVWLGVNMVFKKPIYKLLTWIRDKPYYKNPAPVGGNPKKCK